MNVRNFSRRVLLIAGAVIFAFPLVLEAAKPVTVTVTATDPSEAIQGEMKTVKVTGTGFDNGSKASFLVTGTTDASQIAVTTTFKSSTELQADIQVQPGAPPVTYDVEVITTTGRKGKGTTLFKVNLDPSLILPVSLGVPSECKNSGSTGLNNGAYPADLIVTSAATSCRTGSQRPYYWQNGTWYKVGTLTKGATGTVAGVADDGTVVGWLTDSAGILSAFVVKGNILTTLPLPAGMDNSAAQGISEDGQHILGESFLERDIPAVAMRWNLDVLTGSWTEETIGVLEADFHKHALRSSDDGSVLVGEASHYDPVTYVVWDDGWVWVEGAGVQNLGVGTHAMDISPAGDMIVGHRLEKDLDCIPSCEYEVPVYWVLNGANWEMHDLLPLGGVVSGQSFAEGVGMVNNVGLVVVGWALTGNVFIALAWLPEPSGGYGSPIRLSAIDGWSTSSAMATHVNANGVVAGWSFDHRSSNLAVLWTLPSTP